jgi:hypothetical protein
MAATLRASRRGHRGFASVGFWMAWTFLGLLVASIIALVIRQRAPLLLVLAVSGVALVWLVLWHLSLPGRATAVLVDLGAGNEEGRPRVRRMRRRGPAWHVAWRMPVGVTVSALQHHREAIEQALDISASFWYEHGLVHMRAGTRRLPKHVEFRQFYEKKGR